MKAYIFLCLVALAATPVQADTFRVSGVAANDVLNVRTGPATRFEVAMGLPNGFPGLQKDVCVLVKPRPDAENRADLPEWCAVSQGGPILGWVNARFLAPDAGAADVRLMSGFRAADDPCRIVGESAATVNFLDHTRWLVGCPAGSPEIADILAEFGGDRVATISGFTLLSVPRGE